MSLASTTLHAGSPTFQTHASFTRTLTDPSSMNPSQQPLSISTSFDPHSDSQPMPPASMTPTVRSNSSFQYGLLDFQPNGQISTARSSFTEPTNLAPQPLSAARSAAKPQIYTAVYSGVHVYEVEIDGLAVMRRRHDSWVNATQILKLAGVDKGKRTKVLEREILKEEHEKVQGGYGKYQGTWISYDRGVQFAKQYGVLEQMLPLLEYDMGQDGVSQAGAGLANTPTKEQAMAAQRKQRLLNGTSETNGHTNSSNGTFFKNISKSAANAVSAINKAKLEPSISKQAVVRQVKGNKRDSQQMFGSQDTTTFDSSQQSMHSDMSRSIARAHDNTSFSSHYAANGHHSQFPMSEGPLPKKSRASFSQATTACNEDPYTYNGSLVTEANERGTPRDVDTGFNFTVVGLPPLQQPSNAQGIEKQQLLSSLFFDSMGPDFSGSPALQKLSGQDLDIPIDQTGHTALHWAATLAKTSLLRTLVAKGANIYRLNTGGESALIRAALTTNNLDQGSFPELLELLGPTMEIRDARGRTVLHHIAVSSAVRGPKRRSACRYYLEALLEYVVRSGSAPNSQVSSFNTPQTQPIRPIGLARFMSEIVNATDLSGDTALNLAARIGNRSIIQQLLEVGANPAIPNRGGLRPLDFGVAGNLHTEPEPFYRPLKEPTRTSRIAETGKELVETLKSFISDTETSFSAQMQSKQSIIDQTTNKLREQSLLLTEESRQLTELQVKANERKALRQQIANLRRANEQQRTHLMNLSATNDPPMTTTKVGEADAGLNLDPAIFSQLVALDGDNGATSSTIPANITSWMPTMTENQRQYMISLPNPSVLTARAVAYRRLNSHLEAQSKALRSRSLELETTLRNVVSLCTGVGEDKVDEMIDGLSMAIDSEKGDEVEVGRVREFLRRVEDTVELQ